MILGSLTSASALSLTGLSPTAASRVAARSSAVRTLSSARMQAGVEIPIELCSAAVMPSSEKPSSWSGDLLVVPFWAPPEKDAAIELTGEMAELDATVSGALASLISDHDFKGAAGSSAVVSLPPGTSARRLAVVGLGEEKDYKQSSARKFGAAVATLVIGQKAKVVGAALPESVSAELQQAALEAALIGLSPDMRYKSELEGEQDKLVPQPRDSHSRPQREALATARPELTHAAPIVWWARPAGKTRTERTLPINNGPIPPVAAQAHRSAPYRGRGRDHRRR